MDLFNVQVDETEPKRERKIENRGKYKGAENKRHQRLDKPENKDKKDRTLDPMDPASYSDIPRYKKKNTSVILSRRIFFSFFTTKCNFSFFSCFVEENGQTD